ncbi:MAG: rod shape-determining protein MreC [Oscillospiraceae bacterium]|nr:rod shape-determining protein MreC [Oscillospiraceae bacterium]
MKNVFRNKIFMVAAILVVVLVAATAAFAVFGREGSSLQQAAETVVSPFQKLFSGLWGRLTHFSDAMTKYDELQEENERLRAEIRDMQELIRDAEAYRAENEQLRALLDMREGNEEMELISANLIAWNDASWSSVFTVNRGSGDGVAVGDAVIVDAGLVGVVTAVTRSTAEVSTLADTAVSMPMRVFQCGLTAVGGGDFRLMSAGKLRLSDLPPESGIRIGDTVMTEESRGVPGGILVGVVSEIETEGHGMAAYAVVDAAVPLDRLGQVFIVTDYVRTKLPED